MTSHYTSNNFATTSDSFDVIKPPNNSDKLVAYDNDSGSTDCGSNSDVKKSRVQQFNIVVTPSAASESNDDNFLSFKPNRSKNDNDDIMVQTKSESFESFIVTPPPLDMPLTMEQHVKEYIINYYHGFRTCKSASDVMNVMENIFDENGISDVTRRNDYSVEGRYFDIHHHMTNFHVNIYALDGGKYAVEANHGPDNAAAFQEFVILLVGSFKQRDGFVDYTLVNTHGFESIESFLTPEYNNGFGFIGRYNSDVSVMSGMEEETALGLEPLQFDGGNDNDTNIPAFALENELNDEENTKEFLKDLIASCESGNSDEISFAAPLLAKESEHEDVQKVLASSFDINTLLRLTHNCCDVVLVRSIVVTALNLCQNNEEMNERLSKIESFFTQLRTTWSTERQVSEGTVAASREIVERLDELIGGF